MSFDQLIDDKESEPRATDAFAVRPPVVGRPDFAEVRSPSILDDDRQVPTFAWDCVLLPILRISPLE